MNSSNEFTVNMALQDECPTTNDISTSDNNANLSNTIQNKGAIPKTKNVKPTNVPKKITKLNNNVDEVLVEKSPGSLTDSVLQMHSDVLRFNGFSDQLTRLSGSYLDDYKVALYENGSENCENCCGKNKCVSLHENSFNHDIYNTSGRDNDDGLDTACRISSYQPSTSNSNREIDCEKLQLKIETDSLSSDDNELLSISDDGCIYTYKGDYAADLPSTFFSLDIPISRSPEVVNRLASASPEMDFLEMDFDPGPSGDADSDSQSNAELENAENLSQGPPYAMMDKSNDKIYSDKRPQALSAASSFCKTDNAAKGGSDQSSNTEPIIIPHPRNSIMNLSSPCGSVKQDSPTSSITARLRKIKMPWVCSVAQRTTGRTYSRLTRRHHHSNGELTSPTERILSPSDEVNVIRFYENERGIMSECVAIEKVMIWSEEEAYRKQITQIGPSACGATAVLNVLNALRFPLPSLDSIREVVVTRSRANSSPLTEYLLSRGHAGSTHQDLIDGLETVTEGQVYARFFSMYPERVVNIEAWLYFWISHGAVPIATLNLQKCAGTVSDAWHHQMIFGVSSRGVYLTNPLECMESAYLWPQLTSESVLLIKRDDVLSRWNIKTDINELSKIKDRRWSRMNVVGQVANMIRESTMEQRLGFVNTPYIQIPASYSSGITLAMSVDAPLLPLLKNCSELPLLHIHDEATGCSEVLY